MECICLEVQLISHSNVKHVLWPGPYIPSITQRYAVMSNKMTHKKNIKSIIYYFVRYFVGCAPLQVRSFRIYVRVVLALELRRG